MLSINNIRFRYKANGPAVGPISFQVSRGECLGLLGPSGSGKTTLLRVFAGLLHQGVDGELSGTLVLDPPERDTNAMWSISFMFQQTVLLPHLTVLENVLLPFLADSKSHARKKSEAEELLTRLGLGRELQSLPQVLSGGMRSRVALARALLVRPDALLLDEPFSGLDVASREVAYEAIDSYARIHGTSVVLVTHDLEEAWRLCKRVVVLGRMGSSSSELSEPKTMEFSAFRQAVVEAMNHD